MFSARIEGPTMSRDTSRACVWRACRNDRAARRLAAMFARADEVIE